MKKVAILIPVYNALQYTRKCLENLTSEIYSIKAEEVSFSILVIDDASSDGTSAWIKTNYPDIILISGNGNLWWSGGINKGAKFAIEQMNVDYILLWNNDIIALENYFDNLAKLIIQNIADNKTIIGSKIYVNYSTKLLWSLGGIFDPKSGKKYMVGYYKHDTEISKNTLSINWLPGMGTLVPTQIIKDIGYWDEQSFPQYFGDSEFTLRACNNGYLIKIFENLILENDISNTTIKHQDSFRRLLRTFYDKKSLFNLKYQLKFYKRFSTSPMAYWYLFINYYKYVGGFFKWKFLKFFGVNKKVN